MTAKLRLGGMALQNGILVHSFEHWAAAVRTPEGGIELASGRKPDLPDAVVGTPLLRGVARLLEVIYLLPQVKRRLPSARLPVEDPATALAVLGSALVARMARKSTLTPAVGETIAAGVSLVPALAVLRGSRLAGYHGAEHKTIGAYESGTDAASATKEHERCGSHLVGPLLLATAAGNALVHRLAPERRGPAHALASVAALGVAAETFGWMDRNREHPLSRALARPGHEIQRLAATKEPTDAELEVAEAALAEILRLEEQPA